MYVYTYNVCVSGGVSIVCVEVHVGFVGACLFSSSTQKRKKKQSSCVPSFRHASAGPTLSCSVGPPLRNVKCWWVFCFFFFSFFFCVFLVLGFVLCLGRGRLVLFQSKQVWGRKKPLPKMGNMYTYLPIIKKAPFLFKIYWTLIMNFRI